MNFTMYIWEDVGPVTYWCYLNRDGTITYMASEV